MNLRKSILVLSATLLASAGVVAQDLANQSQSCRQNLSLFSSYAKAGDYDSAYEPWLAAYKECPGSSKNIYIHGVRILKYRYGREKDPAKKAAILEELLSLYDARIKYFGNDPKKGKDAIVQDKVNDYLSIVQDKADYTRVYGWAKAVVLDYKEKAPGSLLYWFLSSSREVARNNPAKSEDYINDYLLASDYLDKQYDATQDPQKREALEKSIARLDESFARSGLASCAILKKIYTLAKVEEKKHDKAFLATTIKLFQNAVTTDDDGKVTGECDSPVPDKAAEYLFKLEPSAKSAMGLAGKFVREKNWSEANKYLEEAIRLSNNNKDKVKCYELMWMIADKTGNGSLASRAQNGILAIDPNNGKILIRQAVNLGNSANSIFPGDAVKARCVYYLVIQRLQAAKAKDSSVAEQADRLIGRYRTMLPKAADIFMHPELGSGKTLAIPGYGSVTLP